MTTRRSFFTTAGAFGGAACATGLPAALCAGPRDLGRSHPIRYQGKILRGIVG